MTAPAESAWRRLPMLAVASGAMVGGLGGLLGLGGAEFRLPLLVVLFRYELRQAVALNVLISLVTVVARTIALVAISGRFSVSGSAITAATPRKH